MKNVLSLAALSSLLLVCSAAQAVEDNASTRGFDHFYNLEYDQAIREFQQLAARRPDDPNIQNHIAQAILYREMFKAGALESELVSGSNPFLRRPKVNTSPEVAKQFDDYIGRAMSISQARLTKNDKDTGALYAMGVAHGLRANYNFLVRKAWMDALKDAGAARRNHNRVIELDPGMTDARLVQGIHDYIVGSLPWHIKMLGFVAGFRGDREEGMKTLRLVAEKGNLNKYDAQVLLAAIYRRERRPKDAIPLLNGLVQVFPRNFLLRLELAQMHSDAGNKAQALDVLDRVEQLKKSNATGYAALPVEKIYYYRGNLLFWYRDLDQALDNLNRVTTRAADLDLNTGVMAWLRVGQIYDMKGQRPQAVEAYKRAIAFAPQSDIAKEAQSYVSSPYKRTGA